MRESNKGERYHLGTLEKLQFSELERAETFAIEARRGSAEEMDQKIIEAANQIKELAGEMEITLERGVLQAILLRVDENGSLEDQIVALRLLYRSSLNDKARVQAELGQTIEALADQHKALVERLNDIFYEMQIFVDEGQISVETKAAIETIVRNIREATTGTLDDVIDRSLQELQTLKTEDGEPVLAGTMLYANEKAEQLLGYDRGTHLRRITMAELLSETDIPPAMRYTLKLFNTGSLEGIEYVLVSRGGQQIPVSVNAHLELNEYPYVAHGVARDIRRERKTEFLEARLRFAQKVETLGQLTAYAAHDFSNLLVVLKHELEAATQAVGTGMGQKAEENLTAMREVIHRMAKTARSLLDFGAKQPLEERVIDLSRFMQEAERLLKRIGTPDSVTLECHVEEGVPHVKVDPTALQRALMNLVLNASQAIPEGLMGGRVEITTQKAFLNDDSEQERQEGVEIIVQDNGQGIPPDHMDRIFEPLFTTKGAGIGTGLGLAEVAGTVTRFGGNIRVASKPGEGARFTIFLPACHDEEEDEEAPPDSRELQRGQGSVVLVEDEETVKNTIARGLRRSGYQVIGVYNSAEGVLQFLESTKNPNIDILVTDVGLEGMNGIELARIVKERVPDIKIIFTSGYRNTGDTIDDELGDFLAKPFTSSTLVDLIRAMMRKDQK